MVVKVLCRWFFEGKEATWVNQVENHPNCCNHLNLKQNNNQCCSQASVYGRSQLRLESAAAADSGLVLFLIVLGILAHCLYLLLLLFLTNLQSNIFISFLLNSLIAHSFHCPLFIFTRIIAS